MRSEPRLPAALEPGLRWLEARTSKSRNYLYGVINGCFGFVGDGFWSPIVLSSFAATLGAPNAVIGLIPAIQSGGWLLPQLVVASRVRHLPRKIVVYRSAVWARTLSYAWIVATSVLLAGLPEALLGAFLLGLLVNALSTGIAGLPFMEIVAKIVPPRERAAFFGVRLLLGGLLALAVSVAVRALLGAGWSFPLAYTVIFALGTLFYSAGYATFALVDEPPDAPQPRASFRADVRGIPAMLREDRAFAAFLMFRLCLTVAALADPFYTVYAIRVIGVEGATVGSFLVALGVLGPLSNALWSRVATRFGSRRVLRWGLGFALLAPVVALLMPEGAGFWFFAVYALSNLGGTAINLANTNYLLGIAPDAARGRAIGVVNTVVGLVSFAAVLGGVIADRVGYVGLFALGAGLYALSWALAGGLRRDL